MDNNAFLSLAPNVRVIASPDSWMEGDALEQLKTTATLPHMQSAVGLPDLHPGRGYPIGAAFSAQHLYPALVGNDIGCGMSLWQTNCKLSKLKIDKLTRRLANIEQPLNNSWDSLIQSAKSNFSIENIPFNTFNFSIEAFDSSLGTIGGGNHFAEYQKVVEIYDSSLFDQANLNKSCLLLLVHSGSRGLGQQILTKHIAKYNHHGIAMCEPDTFNYLAQHDVAVNWAKLNRYLIAERFLDTLGSTGQCTLDVPHNFVERVTETTFLHRKGCTPMDQGFVVIPGSRGDHSYLVEPIVENSELSLCSLAHGAGRKWQRGECRSRLKDKFHKTELNRTIFGSNVICENKALLYEEAPEVYKNCALVMQDLLNAKLVRLVAKLQPVLTFKTLKN